MGTDTIQRSNDDPTGKEKAEINKDSELSEEDKQLQDELNMLVDRLEEPRPELYKAALESMCTLIKSATTSMTSVPKPLKFLTPHYSRMQEIYEKISDNLVKVSCAEVLSVLGMTVSDQEDCKFHTLMYRLLGVNSDIGSWGHEYVRHLTMQIVAYWQENISESTESENKPRKITREQCIELVNQIIPYLMEHNAETEAIDLCIELEKMPLLETYTSKTNYQRVCLYLMCCVPYLLTPDYINVLRCASRLFKKFGDFGGAMRCALRLNDREMVKELYDMASKDTSKAGLAIQRQLAYLLSKHVYMFNSDDEDALQADISDIVSNTLLSEHFIALGTELDIMEPKVPEDVYKSHLESLRTVNSANMDSARANLAASYVNGLLNCGFGKEKLVQDTPDVSLLVKQKEYAKMCTVATMGWVRLWDVDDGLAALGKYLESPDMYTQAGGLLGCGVVNCGVKHECDPAEALLSQYVTSEKEILAKASIIGLGVAYAGSSKAEVINLLLPVIRDTRLPLAGLAALSSGLICVGTLNSDVTSTIIQSFLERDAKSVNISDGKYMTLGLALTCLGRQEDSDVILASLEAVPEPMKSMAHMMCDFCSHAGSGNVLKIQQLLHILSEKYEKSPKGVPDSSKSKSGASGGQESRKSRTNRGTQRSRTHRSTTNAQRDKPEAEEPMDTTPAGENADNESQQTTTDEWDYRAHQGLAAIGAAVIAMGEDVGMDMSFRIFGDLLRFGELPIKRAVPLALALCYVSNPQLKVLDTLSKFSHDADHELSYNSIIAMGICGAGTNNARLAAMLRQLASFHYRDPQNLFLVRIAQGLVHLGKGTMTLSPWHSDRFLTRNISLAGLLILLISCLDSQHSFMAKHDYMLFYLTPAIQPRLLMTFDEDHKPLPVTVRVGQAVDVVGQAGRPKTITGFQTHTTPVLLAAGERAELASDEFMPVTESPLEGFVLLKKNPFYDE